MKHYKLIISFFVFTCLLSCKKELTEPETIAEIKINVLQKNISKEKFDESIFPLVQDLYKKDSLKYKMINHIAKKAAAQKDSIIFKQNLSNLKDELKYY